MYFIEEPVKQKITSWELREKGKLFIASNELQNLAGLLGMKLESLKAILKNGHYIQYYVPKGGGKKRLIETPSKDLLKVQKKLAFYLYAAYHPVKPECVYGCIMSTEDESASKTIYTNALQHVNNKWLLHLDIKDFFHSIPTWKISALLKRPPFKFSKNAATFLSRLLTNQDHLPMGAPASPTLSNIVCLNLDNELLELAHQYNWTYTRYLDDFCFSSPNKFTKEQIDQLKEALYKQRFEINEDKMQLVKIKDKPIVTGLVLQPNKPDVSKKFIKALKKDIKIYHELSTERVQVRGIFHTATLKRFRASIQGRLSFLKYIRGEGDKTYLKLKRRLLLSFEYLL